MPKCSQCINAGTFVPKKGGWFYPIVGSGRRIAQPSFPFCGTLNIGIDITTWRECTAYKEFPKEAEKPVEKEVASA